MKDTGTYTCRTSDLQVKSVTVNILNGGYSEYYIRFNIISTLIVYVTFYVVCLLSVHVFVILTRYCMN